MNRPLGALVPLLACLTLTGCPQAFDALFNQSNPHGLTASTGEGTTISLSWTAPKTSSGDDIAVSSYSIYRDGSYQGSSSGTGWSDSSATPASPHSYTVTATLAAGGTTGSSNSATGWYVPGKPLDWGEGPGTFSEPGTASAAPAEGWYKTLLVLGWTYHVGGGAGAEVRDWDSPWNVLGTFPGGTFQWNGDKTKKVWVKAGTAPLEAWHD